MIARPPRFTIPFSRRGTHRTVFAPWFAILAVAMSLVGIDRSVAASEPDRGARELPGPQGTVLVLSKQLLNEDVSATLPGAELRVSVGEAYRTYRAIVGGRTYTVHEDLSMPPKHYAFDLSERRFRAVSSTLRVELEDYGQIGRIARSVGARSSKAYPDLGFALVRLFDHADPAETVHRLISLPGVKEARLEFEPLPRPRGRPDTRITHPLHASSSPSRLEPGTPPRPTDKNTLASDLLVHIEYVDFDFDSITVGIDVLNWGAAPSVPATLQVELRDEPRFDSLDNVLIQRTSAIPGIDPKSFHETEITIDVTGAGLALQQNASYFVLAVMSEQDSELPGRFYTNLDISGFRTDQLTWPLKHCDASAHGVRQSTQDPLLVQQWHLRNTGQAAYARRGGTADQDIRLGNLTSDGNRGANVSVAVVDTGLEICHPDLADAADPYASFNFNAEHNRWGFEQAHDPFNSAPSGDHGTSVAGLIAAQVNNGLGGQGVAPDVLLRGYNLLAATDSDPADFYDALGASDYNPISSDVDVFNLSFGSLGSPSNLPHDEHTLFAYGVRALRGNLGAIYVKAAGNGYEDCGAVRYPLNLVIGCVSSNTDPTNNIPQLVVVGALNANGVKASYSAIGSNLWVSAPAGEYGQESPAMITTDQAGAKAGYGYTYGDALHGLTAVNPNGYYTHSFNGTSAAAPLVSGIVALMLEAAPGLSWRDVKHILADTARRVDVTSSQIRQDIGGFSRTVRHGWIVNGAGYGFHNAYGFGAVDASAAVSAASTHVPDSLGRYRQSGWFSASPAVQIPDNNGQGATGTIDVAGMPHAASIESVTIEVVLDHPFPHDLGMLLASPAGTESIVNPVFNESLAVDYTDRRLSWRLLSNAFYGENPEGTWRLTVFDGSSGDTGQLLRWRIRFDYGQHETRMPPPADEPQARIPNRHRPEERTGSGASRWETPADRSDGSAPIA